MGLYMTSQLFGGITFGTVMQERIARRLFITRMSVFTVASQPNRENCVASCKSKEEDERCAHLNHEVVEIIGKGLMDRAFPRACVTKISFQAK